MKGVLVCATRPGNSKIEILLVAVHAAARRGLISREGSAGTEAELLTMKELR
jgi:hypothetical protein